MAATLAAAACSEPVRDAPYPAVEPERIRTHVERLRAAETVSPEAGEAGEAAAVDYLTDVFTEIGLNVQHQPVPLTRIVPTRTTLVVTGPDGDTTLEAGTDYLAWSHRHEPSTVAEGELVFVGYGISAPGLEWDDYRDIDVTGRIVLILTGDPMTGRRRVLGTLGEHYYGRRVYKFEEAARQGAAGALLIDLDETAVTDWRLAARSTTELLDVGEHDEQTTHTSAEGWLSPETARGLFPDEPPPGGPEAAATPMQRMRSRRVDGRNQAASGFDELVRRAQQPNFVPVVLPIRARIEVDSEVSTATSTNLVATLPGTADDASYVLLSSQWNDLPAGGPIGGHLTDDERSEHPPGAAILLEAARALVAEAPPLRTIVFLVVTAESEGLVGLDAYLRQPLYPTDRTDAALHVAGFSIHPGESQVSIIGDGPARLKDMVRAAAAEQFRVTSADTDPERLFFYPASDTSFTQRGIPSIFIISRPFDEGIAGLNPEAAPDLTTAVLDTQLLFQVARDMATAEYWPEWNPGR